MNSFFYLLLLAVTISACSPEQGNKPDSRIAAVVNGVEITQREVSSIYERSAAPGVTPEVAREQKRSILSGLVRNELLAQHAIAQKLDRTPEFLLLQYQTRRQLLSGVAQERIVASVKPLSAESLQKIISENPRFFADRKLLVYEQLLMPVVDLPFLESLNVAAGKGASFKDMVDAIKAKKLEFRQVTQTQTTDQLEPAIVKILTSSKPGSPILARVQDKFAMILVLHTVVPIPLVGQAAEQTASNILTSQMRNAALGKKMQEVLDKSKIIYYGEYLPDKSGKKGIVEKVPLPVSDEDRAFLLLIRHIKFAVALMLGVTVAVMFFSESIRLWHDSLWLPRLWRTSQGEGKAEDKEQEQLKPTWTEKIPVSPYIKFFIITMGIINISTFGYQLYVIWEIIPLWMFIVSIPFGLLLGIGLSHLFVRLLLKFLPRMALLAPVILYTFCLLVLLFVTMRPAGLWV